MSKWLVHVFIVTIKFSTADSIFVDTLLDDLKMCFIIVIISTECTRWIESISHPAKEKQKDDEKIYETWGME